MAQLTHFEQNLSHTSEWSPLSLNFNIFQTGFNNDLQFKIISLKLIKYNE